MVRKWAATCKWMTLELKMDQRPKCKFKTYKILRRINGSKFSWLWVCQRVYKYGTKTWWHQSTSYKRKKEKLNFYWCIYNVVLGSGVQQRDSVIHVHIFVLFQILFSYRLSQIDEFYLNKLLFFKFQNTPPRKWKDSPKKGRKYF